MIENPVKEALNGSYFYENFSVARTRKNKSCGICGGSIPAGSAHKGAKLFCDEYYDLNICSSCETTYEKELGEMRRGEYNSY